MNIFANVEVSPLGTRQPRRGKGVGPDGAECVHQWPFFCDTAVGDRQLPCYSFYANMGMLAFVLEDVNGSSRSWNQVYDRVGDQVCTGSGLWLGE
jgi:hypothetical protein